MTLTTMGKTEGRLGISKDNFILVPTYTRSSPVFSTVSALTPRHTLVCLEASRGLSTYQQG